MPIKRHKPEQIIAKLRQIEVFISQGKSLAAACKEAAISEQSYYRWKKEYGGLKLDQAKKLKELERETRRRRPKGSSPFALNGRFGAAATPGACRAPTHAVNTPGSSPGPFTNAALADVKNVVSKP